MSTIISALVSVAIVIAIGALLDRRGWITRDVWQGVERIAYYVFFPALVVSAMGTADLSEAPVRELFIVFIFALVATGALTFALIPLLMGRFGLTGPQFSSVFQGAIRWHTFISVAIVAAAYGPEGVALAAIPMAAIIPLANVASVTVITSFSGSGLPGVGRFAKIIATNPFILSSVGGVIINLLGIPIGGTLLATLDLLGSAATSIGLLVVGAGLRFQAVSRAKAGLAAALVLKLLVMPALVFLGCLFFEVTGTPLAVAIVSAAVPTATGSFILARQLGGDAELMAGILTAQLFAAAASLPFFLWLATG